MLSFYKALYLLFFYHYVECAIPPLSVNKLNRKLVEKKRQDTLDLCRMFNAENEKVESLGHSKYSRVKRGAPSVQNLDDAERVESIVEKLYDEIQENGERVTYRQKIIPTRTTPKTVKNSGRRFDFAPSFLEGPTGPESSSHGTPIDGEAKIPWHKRWKHGIVPYFIDPNTYDSFLAEKIIKAFDYFERTTCIRLQRLRTRPTDKESLQRVEWLYITNPSGTRQCVHSNEYKPNIGVQMVVLGYDCMSLGEIVHEVMHILGFSHEHVREDRDHHISVLWDNIKPGYKKYFEIRRGLLSLPYDYGSILHYPPRAFSKNGKFTLMAEPGIKFGQRDRLSETDVEKVSMIYGNECMNRNKDYLLTTCPTVISTDKPKPNITQQAINDYFKDRLWPYGIVNFRLKDKIEFSIEERENIEAVIKHIEKETCIEFRDLSPTDDDVGSTTERIPADNVEKNQTLPKEVNDDENKIDSNDFHNNTDPEVNQKTDETKKSSEVIVENNHVSSETTTNFPLPPVENPGRRYHKGNSGKKNKKVKQSRNHRLRRAARPLSPSRRHADDVLVLTRSPEPGCHCPPPGRPNSIQELVINADCFNSVNDLLHLFVHVLGLDHQHNMHDRDAYLFIDLTNANEELKKEMTTLLPPEASAGFSYDYQSVMHYPWLQIKDGVTSIMYPTWNDGWAMGHWQGLSSVDVQKLNLLYFDQCQSRKKHIAKNQN